MPPCPPSEFTVQKKVYSAEKSLQCRKKFTVQKKVYSAEKSLQCRIANLLYATV